MTKLAQDVPPLLRKCVDEVIDAPRTNRFTLGETEKTEKTYLGTKIEILLRSMLGFSKGKILDLSVLGVEVDIKNTTQSAWQIPTEALNHPCILIRESEKKALCSMGMIIARPDYLNPGKNQDRKKTFSATGLQNVWWLLKDHPYPPNFFEVMPLTQRQAIMNAGGGTKRVAALFEAVQGKPISRVIVQAIGQEDDFMKRIRRNSGARDILAPKGIAILSGKLNDKLIKQLPLGPVGPDEFISYMPTDPAAVALLRKAKHID